ncbi:hypothetical protein BWQ96_01771 [Gracilariopsis chorda]|uniref:BZIP domain-containing protein n=1 Tax=Gracilariopsis chorda TaxID=448386 RepID=A0A2V3J1K8_9FLOR|nr:hypothetical protein BWQ96_01771 [Gracilariopsis chorda]|eukprot:PXF48311.1 hypothetical protein BWQ96_01771 [Gracilariopsis chorda]
MSSDLPLRMPPHLAATTALATSSVDSAAPAWVSHDLINPYHLHDFENSVDRHPSTIFRIPNMGGPIADWVYTRPTMEAISEHSFRCSAIESTSVFRIEGFTDNHNSVKITPSLSSHWLMVPCQSINGFTLGLAFLDIIYQRKNPGNAIPPLPVGRFVIEDATGEVFVTGWTADIMICGWIQSVIKCERKRELLLYRAPSESGKRPTQLFMRNSFYERRSCHLCGNTQTISSLPSPCSAINARMSTCPTGDQQLTNVASVYRRFRGAYFGLCVKMLYRAGRMCSKEVQPLFIDIRHGLPAVKRRFRSRLHNNVLFAVDAVNSLSATHPTTAPSKMLFFMPNPVKAGYPLIALPEEQADNTHHTNTAFPKLRRSASPNSIRQHAAADTSQLPANHLTRQRQRVDDDVHRSSSHHQRKVRNRASAQRSNLRRRLKLQKDRQDLDLFKGQLPTLRAKQQALLLENRRLRISAFLMGLQYEAELIASQTHPSVS